MILQVGLENNYENRSLAWALDYPRCFSYGADRAEALIRLPQAFVAHKEWVARHQQPSWLDSVKDFDVRLVEAWTVYSIGEDYELKEDGYEVNAWFRHDWKPLTGAEIQQDLAMLAWSRADLLELVQPLSDEILDRRYEGERWSIRGILAHIANAEQWYLHRLGLTNLTHNQLPANVWERLEVVRRLLKDILPGLEGSQQVVGIDGEFWSPRKLARRSLWHEFDHIQHIQKLL